MTHVQRFILGSFLGLICMVVLSHCSGPDGFRSVGGVSDGVPNGGSLGESTTAGDSPNVVSVDIGVIKVPSTTDVSRVIFIVDNSESMARSQEQVAMGVSAMAGQLNSNVGVDFLLYSSSEIKGKMETMVPPTDPYFSALTYETAVDVAPQFGISSGGPNQSGNQGVATILGSFVNTQSSLFATESLLGNFPVVKYDFRINPSLFPTTDGVLRFRSNDSESLRAENIIKLRNSVQIGKTGSSDEQLLCNLLRLSFDESGNTAFTANTKTAVVLLSDTDSSFRDRAINRCAKSIQVHSHLTWKARIAAEPIAKTQIEGKTQIYNPETRVLSAPKYSNGLSVELTDPLANKTGEIGEKFPCTPAQELAARARIPINSNIRAANPFNCVAYKTMVKDYVTTPVFNTVGRNVGLYKSIVLDQPNTIENMSCSTPFTLNSVTYANAIEYARQMSPQYTFSDLASICTETRRHARDSVGPYLTGFAETQYGQITYQSTEDDIHQAIVDRLNAVTGGVSMFGIINDPSTQTPEQTAQAEAPSVNLKSLIAKASGVVVSIFNPASYSQLSAQLNNWISFDTTKTYTIKDFTGAQIKAVSLILPTGELQLSPNDYLVSGDNISIKSVSLSEATTVRVSYIPRVNAD